MLRPSQKAKQNKAFKPASALKKAYVTCAFILYGFFVNIAAAQETQTAQPNSQLLLSPLEQTSVEQTEEVEESQPINLFSPEITIQDAIPSPSEGLPTSPSPQITEEPSLLNKDDNNATDVSAIISEETLSQIDLASIGLIDETSGGFPINVWSKIERDQLKEILQSLPANIKSKNLRKMMRRLLLTSAIIPKPASGLSTDEITQDALEIIQLRVKKLMEMGYNKDAQDLIQMAGLTEEQLKQFAPLLLDIALLEADTEFACTLVENQTDQLVSAYWQKALTYCHFINNDLNAAQFGITLLQDSGHEDPVFYALSDHLFDFDITMPSQYEFTPTTLSLLNLADQNIVDEINFEKLPSIFIKLILKNPHINQLDKINLAEKGIELGVIEPSFLHELYRNIEFSILEWQSPLSFAEKEFSPYTRALLFRVAQEDTVEETRSLLIAKALELGQQHKKYDLIVKIFEDLIVKVPIKSDLWTFSDHAAKALYSLNRPKPANAWFSILAEQSSRIPEANEKLSELWAFARLSNNDATNFINEEEGRKAWLEYIKETLHNEDEVEYIRHILAIYQMLDILGRPSVTMDAWEELIANNLTILSVSPNPGLIKMLKYRADNNDIAGTVGLILQIFQQVDGQHLSAHNIEDIISALLQINLTSEANALAMELAQGYGL